MTFSETDIAWPYPVGTPGTAWSDSDKTQWLKRANVIKRSYNDEVLVPLQNMMSNSEQSELELVQYGCLSIDRDRYKLMAVKSSNWDMSKPCILVTGGVHGYETSGVQGALKFIKEELLPKYRQPESKSFYSDFNFIIAPCVSPWGYECIQRWTYNSVDVNRSFIGPNCERGEGEQTEESRQLIELLKNSVPKGVGVGDGDGDGDDSSQPGSGFLLHVDLHETTDTDATEFRPAKSARNGDAEFDKNSKDGVIPQGFYLVGNNEFQRTEKGDGEKEEVLHTSVLGGPPPKTLSLMTPPAEELMDDDKIPFGAMPSPKALPADVREKFALHVLRAVKEVTPLCPDKEILGFPCEHELGSIIYVPCRTLGLCGSVTGAPYSLTTEVYPDMEGCSSEECNDAQVAVVKSAVEFLAKKA